MEIREKMANKISALHSQRGAAAEQEKLKEQEEITERSDKSRCRGIAAALVKSSTKNQLQCLTQRIRSNSARSGACGELLLSKRASWRVIAAKKQRRNDRMARISCTEQKGPARQFLRSGACGEREQRRLRRA